MAAQVLRGRVHDQIGVQLERPLDQRRGHVLSTTINASGLRRAAQTARRSATASSGLHGDSSHNRSAFGGPVPRGSSQRFRSLLKSHFWLYSRSGTGVESP